MFSTARGEAVWLISLFNKPNGMKCMMEGKAWSSQLQPIAPKELYQAQRNDQLVRWKSNSVQAK